MASMMKSKIGMLRPRFLLWIVGALLLIAPYYTFSDEHEATKYNYGNDWRQIEDIPASEQNNLCRLCEGTYVDPAKEGLVLDKSESGYIKANANKAKINREMMTLSGGFEVTQNQQMLSGNSAKVSRNTGSISIQGNIALRERGLLLRGERGIMQTESQEAEIYDARYTLHTQHLHGKAKSLRRKKNGIVELEKGDLSYCSPLGKPSWLIETNSMRIDPNEGVGKAVGATLKIAGVPIVYLPWIEFPIDKRRRTGLLWPEINSAPRGGLDITLPAYFNLAPNYDLTYEPRFIQERGFYQQVSGRYLGKRSGQWEISGGLLNDDDLYGEENSKSEDSDRWLLQVKQQGRIGYNWFSRIDYNKASDTDYLKDLESFGVNSRRATNLRQSGALLFRSENWIMDISLLQYQSLAYGISQKYKTLPKINASFIPQENLFSFNPILFFQYANFESDLDLVTGERLYGEVGFKYPMRWEFGFLNSTIKQRTVSYNLKNDYLRNSKNPSGNSILGSIDGGIFFDRSISFSGKSYLQTIEPRFFYLYSEKADHRDMPIFDTTELTFDFNQLFRSRWLSGYDRFQNANRISAGISTRYFEQANGREQLNLSLGKIFYFTKNETFLLIQDSETQNMQSDFFMETNFSPSKRFSFHASAQYNSKIRKTRRGRLALRYYGGTGKILNLEHSYRRANFSYSEKTAINETRLSGYLSLSSKWHLFGATSYNWDMRSSMEDFFGIEYDSCCWKARIIYSRYLDRVPGEKLYSAFSPSLQRDESIHFQFLLKGMGAVGPRVDKLMTDMIRGLSFGDD